MPDAAQRAETITLNQTGTTHLSRDVQALNIRKLIPQLVMLLAVVIRATKEK